jgi:Tol biopolymer transport system component
MFAPALSPDRKRVAYVEGTPAHISDPSSGGGGAIVVQSLDGSGARIVASEGNNGAPSWSPDGRQIAFLRGDAVWLMGADGSNQRSLGVTLSVNTHLSWSPDGTRLAVGTGNPSRIAVIGLGGGGVTFAGPPAGQADHPAWSPDGRQLAYSMVRPNGLFVSDADASSPPRQVTTCADPLCARDLEPGWSPDGTQIAFVRFSPGGPQAEAQQIYVVTLATGALRQVTSGPEGHAFPSW